FALWRVPNLLPSFLLTGEDVSRFLLSGADLMAPGVEVPAGGLPVFQKEEVWSVKVPENSCPIAIRVVCISPCITIPPSCSTVLHLSLLSAPTVPCSTFLSFLHPLFHAPPFSPFCTHCSMLHLSLLYAPTVPCSTFLSFMHPLFHAPPFCP
ncbi:unnamed protein product, partial [Closterium sp. NIES-53]